MLPLLLTISQLLQTSYGPLLQTTVTLLFRTALTWTNIKDEILLLCYLFPNLCARLRFVVHIVNS